MNKTIDLSDIDPNAKGSEKTIENRKRDDQQRNIKKIEDCP